MLIIILLALSFFGAMAWFFQKSSPKNEKIQYLARRCPCTRLANTGLLTKILTYVGIVVFIINGLSYEYTGFNIENYTQLFLACLLVFLGYKVRKEDYDRN